MYTASPIISKKNTYKKFSYLSERRILHKLIQAVIREKIAEYEWKPKDETVQGTYILKAADNRRIIIPVKHKYLLGQLEIDGTILLVDNDREIHITNMVQFLHALFDGRMSLTKNINILKDELDNSILNDAIALTAEEWRRKTENQTNSIDTFDTLLEFKQNHSDFSPLAYLEQWVIEGHTIHPCSKTRIGLSIEENEKYAPEWGSDIHLIPLAVHKSHCSSSSMNDKSLTDLLISDYPILLNEMELLDSYMIIPVHPWQYEHTIKKHYQEELNEGMIIPLNSTIPVKPLMSFRSVAPSIGRTLHHIKTAVNIQMTSAKRIVSPASVHNGPIISKLLKEIEWKDSQLKGNVIFLSEIAGSYFCGSRQSAEISLEKNLSCIIRENPESYLAFNELAIPAASLINTLPFSKGILVKELIEKFTKAHKLTIEEGAIRYINLYAKTIIPSLIRLIIKYGISLEAHLQNAIVIFENGEPVKLMIRDNGGIRIHKDRACEWMEIGEIDNTTNLLTDSSEDLYQMFSHAVLHNHLGEIIVKLTKEFGIKESLLWGEVAEVIRETIRNIRIQERHKQQASDFEEHIFAPHTYLKALVTMRLSDSIIDNMYVLADNPLLDREEGEIE